MGDHCHSFAQFNLDNCRHPACGAAAECGAIPMINGRSTRILNSNVLVLNRHYMAVHIVTARRAFVLLYRESAEVIDLDEGHYANYDFGSWCELSDFRSEEKDDEEDWIRTVRFEIQIPRVIRLHAFDRAPRQSLRFNRRNLFARDGHCCQYCGKHEPASQLSLDHVMPRSRGGQTNWENVVCACVACNTKKGGRTPKEARMKLINTPRKPKNNPSLITKLDNPKYQSWKTFLAGSSWAVGGV